MQQYCIRTALPIQHSANGSRDRAHDHSIEIAAYLDKESEGFEQFREMERAINRYLKRYENQFLNALPEFQNGANMEDLGEVFFAGLTAALADTDLTLTRLEVGETPLRTYIIGLDEGSDQDFETEETEIVLSTVGGMEK